MSERARVCCMLDYIEMLETCSHLSHFNLLPHILVDVPLISLVLRHSQNPSDVDLACFLSFRCRAYRTVSTD